MLIKKTIKLPIYDCKVNFILAQDMKKEVSKIYKKYKLLTFEDEEDSECEGMVIFPNIGVYYLLIDEKYLTYNTILHEVYHVASKVCTHRDIQEEESAAWINGYIGSAIISFLLKKQKVIK